MGVENGIRNSLAAQGLRPSTSTAVGPGSIPVWLAKIPQAMQHGENLKKKKENKMLSYFWRVGWRYLTASSENVHTCFLSVAHLRISLKEIMKVVCKDFASTIFNRVIYNSKILETIYLSGNWGFVK